MSFFVLKAGAAALALASVASAAGPYTLANADLYQGNTFFDKFNFIHNDPNRANHGFVNYLTRAQANSTQFGGKLVDYASDGSAYIGVDHWNTRPDGAGGGRPSVRIESTTSYTHGLFIADIAHMPASVCELWPAFWTSNPPNWPDSGEIDILENNNEATTGVTTFHTGAPAGSCTATGNQQTGRQTSSNCNDPATSNQGCSATSTDPNSYGTTFNAAGGGVYAMEWTSTSVKVWNWERGNIPTDILLGTPVPANWGLPITIQSFSTRTSAGIGQDRLNSQQTSCYKSDPTKYATCNLYAGANPTAYAEAYWKINSLKVYKTDNVFKLVETSTSSASAISDEWVLLWVLIFIDLNSCYQTLESTSTSTTTLPLSTKTLSLSLAQVPGTTSSSGISVFAPITGSAVESASPKIATTLSSGGASAFPKFATTFPGGNVNVSSTVTLSKSPEASTSTTTSPVPFKGAANRRVVGSFLGLVLGVVAVVFLL
ncbi:uncharacterized protein PAC_10540 [Phialocephala subalpina]|uniref:GH16 domain-containing protein n=1 Tax=Phialocephala subalpina TaxID=576137 RepID=A0A1L7X6K6_9HELO|nr:uncharacterized protein PAC_10540 [Phialocephala subalpina]